MRGVSSESTHPRRSALNPREEIPEKPQIRKKDPNRKKTEKDNVAWLPVDTARVQELNFTVFYNYAGYFYRHPSLLWGLGLSGRY